MATGLAADRALKDCRNGGYLLDYVDEEEFLTMVTEVWTIEQQMIDRELWAAEKAREAERAKAEKKITKAEDDRKKAEEKAEKAENEKAELIEKINYLESLNKSNGKV